MIAEKIKSYRTIEGYSQEKLAERAGISLRTLQRLENGKTEPRGDTLIRVAEALEVTLDDLLEWKQKEDRAYLSVLNLSALSFLLFPLLGIILPLVLWITKRDQIKGVDQNGKQVLNFQITWTLLLFISLILLVIWVPYAISSSGDISPSIVTSITTPFYGTLGLLYLYNLTIITVNTILVGKGKSTWYYPRINFLRS